MNRGSRFRLNEVRTQLGPDLEERDRCGVATLVAAIIFASGVAATLRIAWNPPLHTYAEYVPISAVLAALFVERLIAKSMSMRGVLCDVLVVILTAMRAVVPPLPFVSGHALLSGYGALTARHWPLRAIAVLVALHVVYTKLIVTGGLASMLAGFGLATMFAVARRR